jgi:hypothetical protein
LGSQCTNYLQQHKLVMTCVAWGADRKDAVLHRTEIFEVFFDFSRKSHENTWRTFLIRRLRPTFVLKRKKILKCKEMVTKASHATVPLNVLLYLVVQLLFDRYCVKLTPSGCQW